MLLEKSYPKLLLYGLVFILLFSGFALILSSAGGKFLLFELLGFIFLLILSFFALFNYHHPQSDFYFYVIFLLYILNLLAIWYVHKTLYISLTTISLVGFFLSIPDKTSKPKVKKTIVSSPLIFEEKPSVTPTSIGDETKIITPKIDNTLFTNFDQPKETKPIHPLKTNPTIKHSPGKYVASKRSNTYHEPRCDWAKKISASHRLWFKAKEQAWEKGYKAHDCVK